MADDPWDYMNWSSERQCAYFALKTLATRLPGPGGDTETEYGTIIFRFLHPTEPGHRYAFLPVEQGRGAKGRFDFDKMKGAVPQWGERWSYAHSHPGGGHFSNWDIDTAAGLQGGFFPMQCTIYMVNKKGAYWYDGRAKAYHKPCGKCDRCTRGAEENCEETKPLRYGEFSGFW